MCDDELIYTTLFKVHHLNIESASIKLSESSWIERSDTYINQPINFHPSLFSFSDDPQFGLSSFYKQLLSSPVSLRTIHTATEGDKHPFQLHDCSHIAIAAAILCKQWFVVGIESFSNSRDKNNQSIGPYSTYFIGENASGSAYITYPEEPKLIRIYNYVYHALAQTPWDSDNARLLLLFLRCITRAPNQRFIVLKLGLDHLFSEWHATVLNAALFFEYLFTNESGDYKKGIQKWNQVFQSISTVDESLVEKIFLYRHLVAHSNPTVAKNKIEEWKNETGLNDLSASTLIRDAIWSTAKSCLNAIIENGAHYRTFQSERPN